MIKGYGNFDKRYEQNFTSIGAMTEGQQFGAGPARMANNIANDNLRPLSQDTVQIDNQVPMPPQEGMLGDLRLTLPLWFVLGKGVDLYNNKCAGDYATSLPAKIGRFGDKIANSKLGTNSFVQGLGTKYAKAKDFAKTRWMNNSTILRNLMENSTVPEWEMAKFTMNNQEQELANEVNHLFKRYLNAGDKKPRFKNLVATAQEKQFVQNVLGQGASEIDKVNCLQLHRANPAKYKDANSIKAVLSQRVTNPNVIKEVLVKELGYDVKLIDKYLANPSKYSKELREFAMKAGRNMRVYHGNYNIVGALTRRISDMSQIGNKMTSIMKGPKGAAGAALPPTTALGRGMSKTMQGLMRGLTFGGGKLGLLIFVAPTLIDMVKNTKEAPDDQKAATIAHGLVESVSWVAAFPLGMKLMHRIGGLRYLGMTKNQVAQYRQAMEKFHAENAAGKFATKEAYTKAWDKVKALRKPSGKLNIFQKALKGVGNLFTQDLEMRKAWKNPATGAIKNSLRWKSIGNAFRHAGGAVAKFAAFMFVAMPFVSKLIEKPVEWIFGKPYDRMAEAEKKAAEAQALADAQAQMTPPVAQNQAVVDAIDNFNQQMEAAKNPQQVVPQSQQSDLNQQMVKPQVAYVKSQDKILKDESRYIPSQECEIPRDSSDFNTRVYMPAQDCQVVQTPEDLSGLDAIELRAKNAEQLAAQVLGRRV